MKMKLKGKSFGFRLLTITLGLLILVAGVSCRQDRLEKGETKVPVIVERATVAPLMLSLDYTATIEPSKLSTLSAEVMGEVEDILVEEGDRVEAGQILIKIEDDTYYAQLLQAKHSVEAASAQLASAMSARPEEIAQAKANFESARIALEIAWNNLKRNQRLYEEGVISKSQLEGAQMQYESAKASFTAAKKALEMANKGAREENKQALEAALNTAKAQLKLARINYQNTKVRAPYEAIVSSIMVEKGDLVSPGMPLAEIMDMSAYKLIVYLPLEKLELVEVGEVVDFDVIGKGITSKAKVTQIFPSAERESRLYEVVLEVKGESQLPVGGFAKVHFRKVMATDKVILPVKAILGVTTENPFVFEVKGDRASRVEVELGRQNGKQVEIVSPLKGGELIVVEGQNYLTDGAKVEVIKTIGVDGANNEAGGEKP